MEECCICLDPLKNDIVIFRCLHKIHYRCFQEWSKRSSLCPICRKEMFIITRADAAMDGDTTVYTPRSKQQGCTIL